MTVIDYYYSAHSAYAWLGARRLYEICDAHGVRLVHKPIELSPVIEAAGGRPFAARTQAHVDYFFGREIERWSELRDVEIIRHRPTYHDAPRALASGAIIAAEEGADALSYAILQAHWRDDADISDPAALAPLIAGCGLDPDTILSAACTDAIQTIYRSNTAEAIALPVFGSPTYVVAGDPFYGQDRLEMLERALAAPFAPSRWRNPPVGG
ncbi:MAG: 2-hydroxychromene-2-carboxylate isomerase [Roseovarius sp.]|nr:2-hydroxychromene-2-carboxylate isomerase [Roseovarius sp.]